MTSPHSHPAAPRSIAEDQPRANGTQAQVHDLYVKHSSSLVRQIARATGSRDVGRELMQEAFARMLRLTAGKLGGLERPEAYLRRVSLNLVRDWGRSRAIAERLPSVPELAASQFVDQVAVLECRDTLRRLEGVMDKMKPRTREIFLAHRVEGLSYSAIATRTGLTVKGVEKQMSKAIAKIDRVLDRA